MATIMATIMASAITLCITSHIYAASATSTTVSSAGTGFYIIALVIRTSLTAVSVSVFQCISVSVDQCISVLVYQLIS